jgi:hypothetical protein
LLYLKALFCDEKILVYVENNYYFMPFGIGGGDWKLLADRLIVPYQIILY